jgi:hypothetical protein
VRRCHVLRTEDDHASGVVEQVDALPALRPYAIVLAHTLREGGLVDLIGEEYVERFGDRGAERRRHLWINSPRLAYMTYMVVAQV